MNNKSLTTPRTTTIAPTAEQHPSTVRQRFSPIDSLPAMVDPNSSIEHPASSIQHPTCRVVAPGEDGASIGQSPSSIEHPESRIQHPASALDPRASSPHMRNGKIARLPKLERDMVNRMLHNHVPYPKIVGALDELGINVTQRNVSNWKTRGGYQEWCAEQERQINLSRLQDNMIDYLRKNDAGQLPEVGLQVAATQLSHMLLQPDAVQQLTAEPEKYSKVVDMLCRLSTHIQTLQKDRDEAVKKASCRHTAEYLKREDEKEVELTRRVYSSKIGNGPRDPDIPHRNELPKRDESYFREPSPEAPDFMEILKMMSKPRPSTPALPAPQPEAVENAEAEKTADA